MHLYHIYHSIDQIWPNLFASGAVRHVEVEWKISGIPVTIGLGPNGSRQFVNDIVIAITSVLIDGFVIRIPTHDLKVVIRGTEADVQYVLQQIRDSMNDCDIEEIRFNLYHAWPNNPSFNICGSISINAIKSDKSDDKFDNKSRGSNSSAGSRK
jgi:hypothetical protein